MTKLLVVDDEPLICQSFQWVFTSGEVEVITAGTLAEGWQRIEEHRPDVIVLDLQLPDGSGLDLFDRIRADDPHRPVLFLTARGTTDTAIEAMKRGAFDYLGKPFELEQMARLLERAFQATRIMREPAVVPDDLPTDQIVGRSSIIRELSKQIGRVAALDVTVLILGESGSGKELVARALYQHGRRADKPFLAVNCAAIPEGLVESELFGHEPGAFTGAVRRRIGRFEQADGCTLFLPDEIGDMPLSVQAKVLRFLQDQTFERVGGQNSISTHVRVLAATNQNLERLIAEGRFRGDLYYRLKEITIRVPPLRDRTEDIAELARHFLFQFARETHSDVCGFAPETLEIFSRYPWPGNVRELRGAIKQAVIKTAGPIILPEFLPPELCGEGCKGVEKKVEPKQLSAVHPGTHRDSLLPEELDPGMSIEALLGAGGNGLYNHVLGAVERELIKRVLRHTHGHLGHACERLGIDRKTLRSKLRELGIIPDRTMLDGAGSPHD